MYYFGYAQAFGAGHFFSFDAFLILTAWTLREMGATSLSAVCWDRGYLAGGLGYGCRLLALTICFVVDFLREDTVGPGIQHFQIPRSSLPTGFCCACV
jgi:hypothetical protein